MLRLELNPSLDIPRFAAVYAQQGVVRIPEVLSPESAETVTRILEQTPWHLGMSESGGPRRETYDAQRLQALGESAVRDRVTAELKRAGSGFAYLYLLYPMIEAYMTYQDPGHPIHKVSEFLNSGQFLQLMRDVTGRSDIVKADALATRYRPGDFLTYHDDGDMTIRACAYTLGFTKLWRPDWGGQLLFHDETTGDITEGFMPAFNTLTLFKVPRAHSVAPVASYAAASRLSIVGWGRNDPGRPSGQ